MSSVRLVPLGGLGEIGMNCMAIEADGQIVVIDCGVTFPDHDLGVNIIHPAFDYLFDHEAQVRAVVLTHGHEDHIGALPFLLREIDLPVYGTPYTLGLVRNRLREHDLEHDTRFITTEVRRTFRIGPFTFEPIRVTHSIADATALAIQTPAGRVVHTGDFKIDERPLDGEYFDAERFSELGREGVRLLLSDSTNAQVDGRAGDEAGVAEALEDSIRHHPGRVVVAVFASNVHRLRMLFDIAARVGRRVLLLGRSVRRHVENSQATGYLKVPPGCLVELEEADRVPRDQLLVVATGTQGEAPAALARLSRNDFAELRLSAGDRVLLSSRVIPGNERPVYDLVNALERRGVEVRFQRTHPGIHVSGHAHRAEQRTMMELTRPESFVPVHGTYLHLRHHADLAREVGIGDVRVVENGTVLELTADSLEIVGEVPVGRVEIDSSLEEVTPEMLKDRALLAELGVAFAVVQLSREGRVVGSPRVQTRGVIPDDLPDEFLWRAGQYVGEAVVRASKRFKRRPCSESELSQTAAHALRRFFRRELGRKPLCEATVLLP